MTDALVLGAGIAGLWTAHILAEGGHKVTVLSGSDSSSSTSAVAAAVLVPFLPGDPTSTVFQRSVRWARETLDHMSELDPLNEYLERMPCYEFGLKGIIEYGFSVAALDFLDFSTFELVDLGTTVFDCDMAVKFDVVLCNSSVYLEWLNGNLRGMGVSFRQATIATPDDVPWNLYDVVFNCLGYQSVFPDNELYPVFGQAMIVPTPAPESPPFVIGAGAHAVFAHRRGFHIGAHFLQDVGDRLPRQDLYQSSVEFVSGPYQALCESVELPAPKIDLDAISFVSAGVRPFRQSGPRVEKDAKFPTLVHNYGHGAHGWTIGYGSSLEAVAIAGLL